MNFGVKRKLILEIGGFSEALGMAGDQLGYGEETHFQNQVWKACPDVKVWYFPLMLVRHEVRAAKMEMSFYFKHSFALGRDQAKYLITPRNRRRQFLAVLKNTLLMLGSFVRLLVLSAIGLAHRRDNTWWQQIGEYLQKDTCVLICAATRDAFQLFRKSPLV
jgi:hypothetical protein